VIAFTASTAAAAGPLHKFSYEGRGTNVVHIAAGQVRELWKGHAKQFGAITAHVAGFIQLLGGRNFAIHATIVIVQDSSDDVVIGACDGTGILPEPHGSENWSCDDIGGTGKFSHSRGHWKLHIDIHRTSLQDGVQRNRFTETGTGRIS
jgi:hypothetical protein